MRKMKFREKRISVFYFNQQEHSLHSWKDIKDKWHVQGHMRTYKVTQISTLPSWSVYSPVSTQDLLSDLSHNGGRKQRKPEWPTQNCNSAQNLLLGSPRRIEKDD